MTLAQVPARAADAPAVPLFVLQGAAAAIRAGEAGDAPAIHALITANLERGHLLPRRLDELTRRADRFVVATLRRDPVGCAELARLSPEVAEIRSLVVDETCRGAGIGGRIVQTLLDRARAEGFSTVCVFTHDPAPFVRLGFSIVPHVWLPEKIATDCCTCPLFRRCGQHALVWRLSR